MTPGTDRTLYLAAHLFLQQGESDGDISLRCAFELW
jgi:hypothetical protein